MGAVAPKKIAPNESGEIEAIFYPRGYNGRVKKTFYISSNDPTTPTVKLVLIASVAIPCPWLTIETAPSH